MTGFPEEFEKAFSKPYAHMCRAKDCIISINDGDTFILDSNEFGRFHPYCSVECSEKQILDYPIKATYSASKEKCGALNCPNILQFSVEYFDIPGWPGLCCSEECADNQFNLVWGSDDGGREQTAQREIDRDYWNLKRERWK